MKWLAQGTIYPDVIESAKSESGAATVIKTHHNVGGLPEKLSLKIIEPLRDLFKDEVRRLGVALGLPPALIERHPFPGPGLAVRVLGEVSPPRAEIARAADAIFTEELRAAGQSRATAQAFAVLLPVKTVGVMGGFSHLRKCRRLARGDDRRFYDRRLDAPALRFAGARVFAHHQRSGGSQSRRLRHFVEAARDRRMGISG